MKGNSEQTIHSHLFELRKAVLRSIICIFVITLILIPFSNEIYNFVASPLIAMLPDGSSMIATEVASPFFAPFKLTLCCAIFFSMPFILFQIWTFIAPGLYKSEKRLMLPILISSSLLFYLGILFCYHSVFPILFSFFTSSAPNNIMIMTDINHYLNFILKLFFAFGVSFEIPIATIILVKSKIITTEELSSNRPYVIIFAFFVGMLLTPPDVISQILLAIPICFLFEIGLVLGKFFEK